jgi:hypothetical protein
MGTHVFCRRGQPGRRDDARRPGALATIPSNATLRVAVHRMAELEVTRLLVTNPSDPHHLVGKIALHDLLKARSRQLENEQRRERVLPFEYILPAWMRR